MVDEHRIPPFLGRITDINGAPVGTCFQVDMGYLVTAWHVIGQALGREPRLGDQLWYAPLGAAVDVFFPAEVNAFDQESDLAVLRTGQSLPDSTSHFALSDNQDLGTPFSLTGIASMTEGYDRVTYPWLNARGEWDGLTKDHKQRLRGSGTARNTEPGMSGCPVIRADGAVIGVLIERYESGTSWSPGRVWFARSEDLLRLLPSAVSVAVQTKERPKRRSDQVALVEEPVDRAIVLENAYFIDPPLWDRPWQEARAALQTGKVVVISGPPGVGTTTFAQRLLATTLDARMRLIGLEPDEWETPRTSALPADPWRAYILNLRDPQHDRPSNAFINDLQSFGEELGSLQSRMVITAGDNVWTGGGFHVAPHLHHVRLMDPPNPVDLVKRYVEIDYPRLTEVVSSEAVRRHLLGRNAVQAIQAVDVMRALADGTEDADNAKLIDLIANAIDDHHELLDVLFGGRPLSMKRQGQGEGRQESYSPLSAEDRCLMLVLAFKQPSRLSRIEAEARRLMALLGGVDSENSSQEPLIEVFARPGLRGRFAGISAEVVQGEVVRFPRPSLAAATVRYVWENYSELRPSIVKWLIGGAASADSSRLAEDWLTDLVVRNQDVEFIRGALRKALIQGHADMLVSVLVAALGDGHMRRECERLLYYWATQVEMQSVVIQAAQHHFINTQSAIALRRLQRVADSTKTPPHVHEQLVRAFACVAKAIPAFSDTVVDWLRLSPRRFSSILACLAILKNQGAARWFLNLREEDVSVDPVVVALFSNPLGHSALVSFLAGAAEDSSTYNSVLDHMAEAIEKEGALASLLTLPKIFDDFALGLNPMLDLSSRLKLSLVPGYSAAEAG
ncbi:trypsin-like peptidase domain-containing protein [Micromonospora sp. NPDC049051]|uniref:S1 family peptidase n=1 Tax=Micromonospora sp. NPDC049051 TaxID=3364264 RepID=UPI0037165569